MITLTSNFLNEEFDPVGESCVDDTSLSVIKIFASTISSDAPAGKSRYNLSLSLAPTL